MSRCALYYNESKNGVYLLVDCKSCRFSARKCDISCWALLSWREEKPSRVNWHHTDAIAVRCSVCRFSHNKLPSFRCPSGCVIEW